MATNQTEKLINRNVWAIIAIGALSGMLYGYDIGIINGALLYMKHDIAMSVQELSFVVAAVLGGGAIATLISGSLADKFGRKHLLLASACLFIVGVVLLAEANTYATVLAGRLIQGLGVGILTIVAPLYLTESVPARYRGRGLAAFQLTLTAGILLSNLVGYLTAHAGGNWRFMFWSAALPGAVLFLSLFFLPESPRWLMAKQLKDKAFEIIHKTHSASEAARVCQALAEQGHHRVNFFIALRQLFNPRFFYPVIIVMLIACVQQLTGINSILQLNATILKDAGMHSNTMAILGGVTVTFINFVVTMIALALVDKLGRKPLLSFGTAGVTLALLFCGVVFMFFPDGPLKAYLLVAGIMVYIFSFAIGPGVVIWLALSELLPTAIRSVGMSVALTLNSLVSTILASAFLPMSQHIGFSGVFFFCAACSAIYFYIAYFKMPETKNKSLEEIEHFFDKEIQAV